jgi:hypothetical protein
MTAGFHVEDYQISFVGSLNQKATRYWSKALPLEKNDFKDGPVLSQ